MNNKSGIHIRTRLLEAGVIFLFATATAPLLYYAMTGSASMYFLLDHGSPVNLSSVLRKGGVRYLLLSLFDDWLFFPLPSIALFGSIGLVCGLTWLSGPYWCRRCGRQRHGDPTFYDRPENFVWRCRLLGAIAGIPSLAAVFAYYYSFLHFIPLDGFIPVGSIAAGVLVHMLLSPSADIGPELGLEHLPRLLESYSMKAVISFPFLAAPFAFSATIGACCGWFYGRFFRPAVRRLLPNLLPAP